MIRPSSGREWWDRLDAEPGVQAVLARAERCAKLTLPSLYFEEGVEVADDEIVPPEWQSYGAQLVNHLATRLMLALFAPSRPFTRMDPTVGFTQAAAEARLSEADLRSILGLAEKEMTKEVDRRAMRPKLFELLKQLLVVGPTTLVLDRENEQLRVISLRHFRVKRDIYGRVHTHVIKESVEADELPQELRDILPPSKTGKVDYFILVQRNYNKKDEYTVKHYVEDVHLAAWDKAYPKHKLPYQAITWTLPDSANYGNSLVAEYAGDFTAFAQLCSAMTTAGVLASEYRWLKDPAATMDGKEFEDSENGEVISGEKGSLSIVNVAVEMASAMQAQDIARKPLEQRLGRAFVLASAVVRDSERTTGIEIRQLAQELDTGLGGGYSRIAVDVQAPMSYFLLDLMDVQFKPKDIELTIVTGLDALSRSGDLSNLKEWLASLAGAATIPEQALKRLKFKDLASDLATPLGIQADKYLYSDEEVAAQDDAEAKRTALARGADSALPQPQQGPNTNG
jgi:hypothetical protein